MNLTHDELIETACALLECAFQALAAARAAAEPHQQQRHRERASLLLQSLRKIRESCEAASAEPVDYRAPAHISDAPRAVTAECAGPASHYLRVVRGEDI